MLAVPEIEAYQLLRGKRLDASTAAFIAFSDRELQVREGSRSASPGDCLNDWREPKSGLAAA
jgi:hypothetical protein